MAELLSSPASAFAMLGTFAALGGCLYIRKIKLSIRMLVYVALMLALTIILQQLSIFHLPQGGNITLGSMVPLLLIAWRFGPGVGAMAGFLYGLINILQDPFILHPVQVLFDYPLPIMAMGLAGFFPKHIFLGTALAFATRFLCHFISGIVFFASYAPEGMSPILYSLTVNASLIVPEFIICCLLLKYLPLDKIIASMASEFHSTNGTN